jgi:hypothetical protein
VSLTPEQKRHLVDGCLAEFDFDKVVKVMKALDWRWNTHFGQPGRVPNRVPDRDEAREFARSLLEGLGGGNYLASGGFVARSGELRDGRPYFSLTFELEAKSAVCPR